MTRIRLSNLRRSHGSGKMVACTATFIPVQGAIATHDCTLDYAISLTQGLDMGDRAVIENAGEVLLWLHLNVDFIPH